MHARSDEFLSLRERLQALPPAPESGVDAWPAIEARVAEAPRRRSRSNGARRLPRPRRWSRSACLPRRDGSTFRRPRPSRCGRRGRRGGVVADLRECSQALEALLAAMPERPAVERAGTSCRSRGCRSQVQGLIDELSVAGPTALHRGRAAVAGLRRNHGRSCSGAMLRRSRRRQTGCPRSSSIHPRSQPRGRRCSRAPLGARHLALAAASLIWPRWSSSCRPRGSSLTSQRARSPTSAASCMAGRKTTRRLRARRARRSMPASTSAAAPRATRALTWSALAGLPGRAGQGLAEVVMW